MNVYAFASGRSLKNIDPQKLGEELERIRGEKGQLIAADVLEEARNPESPLHAGFEWDDHAAAEEHRLNQARRLIVSIKILNPPTGKPTKAYVNVRGPQGRSYMPVQEAMSDEQLRARVLAEAAQLVESLERRYGHLVEIGDLIDRMKKAVG